MPNALTQLRVELASQLDGTDVDYTVVDHVPGDIGSNMVIIAPSQPYLTPAATYGQTTVRLQLFIIAAPADATVLASDELDELCTQLLDRLPASWDFPDGFTAPFITTHSDADYLAIRCDVVTDTQL